VLREPFSVCKGPPLSGGRWTIRTLRGGKPFSLYNGISTEITKLFFLRFLGLRLAEEKGLRVCQSFPSLSSAAFAVAIIMPLT
jgi:hypothetical protein